MSGVFFDIQACEGFGYGSDGIHEEIHVVVATSPAGDVTAAYVWRAGGVWWCSPEPSPMAAGAVPRSALPTELGEWTREEALEFARVVLASFLEKGES